MKKIRIIFICIFVIATVLSLCACNNTCEHVCPVCGKCTDSESTNKACAQKCNCASNATADYVCHSVTGTLHEVSITPTNNVFVSPMNGPAYSIVTSSDANAREASAFIIKQLKAATGYEVSSQVYDKTTFDAEGKYIIIGVDELFASAGLAMPQVDLGTAGYYIKSVGDYVFIMSPGTEGYQMGAIAFLEAVCGYDMIGYNTPVYESAAETMPILDITEKPDFEYRMPSQPLGGPEKTTDYAMGYTDNSIMISGEYGSNCWHSTFWLLQPEIYKDTHPLWYTNETFSFNVTSADSYHGQLCFTAHGDPDEYEAMVAKMTERCITWIDMRPQLNCLNIGEQDDYDWCDCDRCSEIIEHYGAQSATYIMFVNDVAERIEEHYKGTGRNVLITLFAYHSSEKAPVTQDEQGNYHAIDGLHTRENVGVIFAPIKGHFNHTFYEDDNNLYAERLRSWSAVTDNIVCWLYQLNTTYYMYPYNTWDSAPDTYRLCYNYNCVFMYDQGQWNQNVCTGFTKLKEYLSSHLYRNLNENEAELTDKFFNNYYGSAGSIMRKFFNEVQVRWEYLNNTYPAQLPGGISDTINLAEYWPEKLINHWYNDYIKEALEEINDLQYTDPDKYQLYKDHIDLEAMFPLYVQCTTYSASYNPDQLNEKRLAFKSICQRLNVTLQAEHDQVGMAGLFESWGI